SPARLWCALADLAREPRPEDVVVKVRAGDEQTDEQSLHAEHPVEAARRRVVGVLARGERDPGGDGDAERAPAERPPAAAELAELLRPQRSLEPLRWWDGDEDERDRAADPHRRGQHVHDPQRELHATSLAEPAGDRERWAGLAHLLAPDADACAAAEPDGSLEGAARVGEHRASH